MRRVLIVALVIAPILASGCSADEGPMGAPGCADEIILVAQSVPEAAFVPCFEELPGGWDLSEVSIGNDGTTVTLDSDRAGVGAATFSYRDQCDVRRVGRIASDQEGVRVHEEIDQLAGGLQSTRYFVFDQGCVAVHFDFDEFDDIDHSENLLASMRLVRRVDLNEALRREDGLFVV